MGDTIEHFAIALSGGRGTENAAAESGAVEGAEGGVLSPDSGLYGRRTRRRWRWCWQDILSSPIQPYLRLQKQILHPHSFSKILYYLRIPTSPRRHDLARQQIGVDDGEIIGRSREDGSYGRFARGDGAG